MKKKLIILSKNKIKICLILKVFPGEIYDLYFYEILDNHNNLNSFFNVDKVKFDCDNRTVSFIAKKWYYKRTKYIINFD